jgi:hypothetical protein
VVLAVLLRDHGPICPDPVEQDVAVLVLRVAVANHHELDAVGIMASPLEVFVCEPGHVVVRQRALVSSEAQRQVLDGFADVGPLLPYGFELACQFHARAAGHVAADYLGLVIAIEASPFVKDVTRGSPEAASSGDPGNHASSPSGLRVVPRTSARTVPTNRVTSSRASRTSGAARLTTTLSHASGDGIDVGRELAQGVVRLAVHLGYRAHRSARGERP